MHAFPSARRFYHIAQPRERAHFLNIRKTAASVFDALFVVAPNTNMLTVTALIDGMRAANRMGNAEFFRYRIATVDGKAAVASNGFLVPAQHALPEAPPADHIFVLASYEPKPTVVRPFIRYLRKAARHAPCFYGIDQGSLILAEAGLLDSHRATTHWEVLPSLLERYPKVSFVEELFVVDRARVTCAGHTACVDLIVHIIADRYGSPLAASVMREMIYGRLRNGQERQRLLETGSAGTPDHPLGRAITIMSNNLDSPLPISRISERSGISRRQLETLFEQHLRRSPARHYMGLRLSLARELLLYSSLRIVDVSSACGFASQANFARAFSREYETTPSAYRVNFRETLDRPVAAVRQGRVLRTRGGRRK